MSGEIGSFIVFVNDNNCFIPWTAANRACRRPDYRLRVRGAKSQKWFGHTMVRSHHRPAPDATRWEAHAQDEVTGTIDMKVLIVLYEGFTEYEYAIPLMALHYQQIPFEIVDLSHTDITGMTGLKATTSKVLGEVKAGAYGALFLPCIDREQRDQALRDEGRLTLIREFDRVGRLIAAVCAAPVFLGAAGFLIG
ncbi:MAG: DJ-1/PfpI family protein [Anaerolineales bacterium]|nr:DJ-1/PfpI family protein [Anaerolineales bacterium]